MKLNSLLLTIILSTNLPVFGQINPKPSEVKNQDKITTLDNTQSNIYYYLKDTIKTDWIKQNPELANTKASFFNNETAKKYIISPIEFSSKSEPFAWDDNLTIINFLLTKDKNIKTLRGENADSIYKGIKIIWNQQISGLIWTNDSIYNANIKSWKLYEKTDCPSTIIFPILSFEKLFDVPNALTNNLSGLAIIPFTQEIKKIIAIKTEIKSKAGIVLSGTGFDFNNDGINDAFLNYERVDDTTSYIRLYINISGRWECKWIELNEECI